MSIYQLCPLLPGSRATAALFMVLGAFLGAPARAAEPGLDAGFRSPPDSARPHTWWHWMNGNVTREGITADLESMRRVGIGGAQIFVPDQGIPAGPARYLGDEWRGHVKFAAEECRRLGLDLGMHNCAGWSSSGGPWVAPEGAMQEVVLAEVRVTGPARFPGVLPRPAAKRGFYRDIAVLAFPAPGGETGDLEDFSPWVTGSVSSFDGAAVLAADPDRFARLPAPTEKNPQYVRFEFPRPFTARMLSVMPGPGLDRFTGRLEASDDGVEFRTVREMDLRDGWDRVVRTWDFPAVTARYFRLLVVSGNGDVVLSGVRLSPRLGVGSLMAKAAYVRGDDWERGGPVTVPGEMIVPRAGIVDLTTRLAADGALDWDVPAGDWIVVRAGFTPTGRQNHPAPPEATGLECDKLSARAADAHFSAVLDRLLRELGPLAGTAFKNVIIDSYEVGSQNWTPGFGAEFVHRRGYDPSPYLPVLTGRIVESVLVSERFLWDLRRTVADLYAEKYYGRMAELAHKKGLKIGIEPYGNGSFEDLACGGRADVPMGEFWIGGGALGTCKLAAAAGHTYGRRIIGAEAFTANTEVAGWRNYPGSMKILGDDAFCRGVNRMIFHTFVHQPRSDLVPGFTMGQWGTHFGRLNTWWEPGAAWMKYLARCQFMLQRGVFVADVLYFSGEDVPVGIKSDEPGLPPGYDYDGCSSEVVLDRLKVENRRLVLPDGVSYAVLVLPPGDAMTPKMLKRIEYLVGQGATVLGPKPRKSPSLEGYPESDRIVADLADAVWGDCDGKAVTAHGFGKGTVGWGRGLKDVLSGLGVAPDFAYKGRGARLKYIHRATASEDIYFVSNQRDGLAEVRASFRAAGRVPELMHPETGLVEPAPVYEEKDGRTEVPLRLEPAESVFVVFRRRAPGGEHAVDASPTRAADPYPPFEITRAVYEASDGAGSADVTGIVRKLVKDGFLDLEVENDNLGGDPVPMHFKSLRVEYVTEAGKRTALAREHDTLVVPESPPSLEPAPWRVAAAADGALDLVARQAGGYEVKTSTGRTVRVEVPAVPGPVTVKGPYEVRFPAGWKAPDKVILEKLVSWSDHADAGIRNFSGTAAYSAEFDLGPGLVRPGTDLTLDLGKVAVMAEVRVNGRDLGVLWKAPYRIDLTGAVREGRNRLTVRVTNLWPNRLIGDAALPEDVVWEDKHLKEWPAWVKEGKPSPAGRLTFATWRHWYADSPLLESGLIGPVVVYPALRIRVPTGR